MILAESPRDGQRRMAQAAFFDRRVGVGAEERDTRRIVVQLVQRDAKRLDHLRGRGQSQAPHVGGKQPIQRPARAIVVQTRHFLGRQVQQGRAMPRRPIRRSHRAALSTRAGCGPEPAGSWPSKASCVRLPPADRPASGSSNRIRERTSLMIGNAPTEYDRSVVPVAWAEGTLGHRVAGSRAIGSSATGHIVPPCTVFRVRSGRCRPRGRGPARNDPHHKEMSSEAKRQDPRIVVNALASITFDVSRVRLNLRQRHFPVSATHSARRNQGGHCRRPSFRKECPADAAAQNNPTPPLAQPTSATRRQKSKENHREMCGK